MAASVLKTLISPQSNHPAGIEDSATPDTSTDFPDMLRLIVDHIPVAIAMFDKDMHYLLANRQWITEFQLQPQLPILGRSQYDVFPKLHTGWRQLYERALQGYTMRSDQPVPAAAGALPMVVRCEVRPWRIKDDGSIGGVIVTCSKAPIASLPAPAATDTTAPTTTKSADTTTPEPQPQGPFTLVQSLDSGPPSAPSNTSATGPDIDSLSIPILVLDHRGHIDSVNASAAEWVLAAGIEPGETGFWQIVSAEQGQAELATQLQSAIATLKKSHIPQLITVRHLRQWHSDGTADSSAPTPAESPKAGDSPSAAPTPPPSIPTRWLLCTHAKQKELLMAIGLSGFSPFESISKVGIQLELPSQPSTNNLNAAAAAAATQHLAELAATKQAVSRLEQQVRTLESAERAILRRVQQVESTLEAMPGGILVLDEFGSPLLQNSHLKQLLGREIQPDQRIEDWLSANCGDPLLKNEICRVWQEDIWRRQLTRTLSLSTAGELTKEIELRPSSISHGGLLIHFQEVSQQCRIQEQLGSLEAKFRSLLQENPLPILLTDRSGLIFDANRAAENLFHQSRSELRQLSLDALLTPASADSRKDALRELQQTASSSQRLTVTLAGEDALKMQLTLASTRSNLGSALHTLHFFEPILSWPPPTPQPSPSPSPQIPELPLQQTPLPDADSPPETDQLIGDWLLSTNVHGRIKEISPQAETFFDLSAENLIQHPLHELFSPSNPSGFYQTSLPTAISAGTAEWTCFIGQHQNRKLTFQIFAGDHGAAQIALHLPPAPKPQPTPPNSPQTTPHPAAPAPGIGETHNRIQHQLHILSSVLNVRSHTDANPASTAHLLTATQSRLRALATLHAHLEEQAHKGLSQIHLPSFVETLSNSLRNSQDSTHPQIRLEIDPTITLPPEWHMPFTIILHEALSNALTHAFPDDQKSPENHVLVRLQSAPTGKITLLIQDNGCGLPTNASELGTGLRLISIFADEMRSQWTIESQPNAGTQLEADFFIAFIDN